MVDKNLIGSLGVTDEEVNGQLAEAMGGEFSAAGLEKTLRDSSSQFQVGNVLKGRIVNVTGNDVFVEVGLKSEGTLDLSE